MLILSTKMTIQILHQDDIDINVLGIIYQIIPKMPIIYRYTVNISLTCNVQPCKLGS